MTSPRSAEADVLAAGDRSWLRARMRRWFATNARDFPWRRTADPYEVLVAELMLQRTRADLVPKVFTTFISQYPDPVALARADTDDVLKILEPLGFRHRNARLAALGRELCTRFGGRVPDSEVALGTLPGVGRYVANAVMVVAFGARRPLLDPNVVRVLTRCFGVVPGRSRARDDKALWRLLEDAVADRDPRPVALGLIDLGAMVCRPKKPQCSTCPLRSRCFAFRTGLVAPAD